LERGVLNRSASVAIDLLPVVTEESDDRAGSGVEEVLLQSVHEASVRILILIYKENRKARGHHGPELGAGE
jgi:hypothetical protein